MTVKAQPMWVKDRNRGHEGSVTPEKRASQYPGVFFAAAGQMWCKFCKQVVNHTRKSTCDNHIASGKHRLVRSYSVSVEAMISNYRQPFLGNGTFFLNVCGVNKSHSLHG